MRLFFVGLRPILLGLAIAVVCGPVHTLAAQKTKPNPPPPKPQAQGKKQNNNNAKQQQQNAQTQLERFEKMSPADREKALAKLPPERRAQLEQRLQRLEKMSPEQRQRVEQRLQQMRSLPPDRQAAVRDELQTLRNMPPAQRRSRLNGPEIRDNYSKEEQDLIRSSVLGGGANAKN